MGQGWVFPLRHIIAYSLQTAFLTGVLTLSTNKSRQSWWCWSFLVW